MMFFIGMMLLQLSVAFAAKRALIYSGPGACVEGCAQAASDMAVRNGFIPTLVGPDQITAQSTDADKQNLFKDVVIYLQPGGHSRTVFQNMTQAMVDAIKNFVSSGGAYVGFCAGAFSSTRKVGTTNYVGFDIMPGKTILYDGTRSNAAILEVNWNGRNRSMYWEGGPYITDLPDGAASAVAYYPSGEIAAAKSHYGKGRVFVTGLHPEAPQWWRDYYQMTDSDGLDYDIADEMITWATAAR